MTETRLPGGWQWTTSPFDLRHGIAVAKVWWINDVPAIRCQVGTELDRMGHRRTFGWLSYAKAERQFRRGKQRYDRNHWRWVFIMDVPDLPPDPLAAAMSIELDYGHIEQTVLDTFTSMDRRSSSVPLWEVEDGNE